LTSLCTVEAQPVRVYACDRCGHLQTPPMADLESYYATSYRILIESEEDDQLYRVVDGRRVFRAEHQAKTMLDLLALPRGAQVLDYGAAKGATLRRVLRERPDLAVHLFDVSDLYRPFWEGFVPPDRQATFEVPSEWLGRFDAVVSFFMLEHVQDPATVLKQVRSLLADGGSLYLVLPNFQDNIADLIVVDHVNHFSETSIRHLACESGFAPKLVDDSAHQGAWVALLTKTDDAASPVAPDRASVRRTLNRAIELAAYWSSTEAHIRENEAAVSGRAAAVYGAGFYGSLILTSLQDRSNVIAIIDQNPFLQGRTHFGLPVIAPEELPETVADLYVGLNPAVAEETVQSVEALADRCLRFHYL